MDGDRNDAKERARSVSLRGLNPIHLFHAMASFANTPISPPTPSLAAPVKPTCASYKEAYIAARCRQGRYALAALYALALFFTVAFQLKLGKQAMTAT